MATRCPKLVRGSVMRLTRLDSCGVPVVGASTTVVSDGFVQIAFSPQYEGPDPIRKKNANGNLCVNDPGCASLAQIDAEIQFCGVDPNAFNIIAGAPLVLDDATPTPNTVGFSIRAGQTCQTRFALEVWTDEVDQPCTAGVKAYGYMLLPMLLNPQFGDWTVANDAIDFTISASSFQGNGWGVGPYDVINVLPGPVPGPLIAPGVNANDLFWFEETTLAPPVAACAVAALP